MVDFSEGSDSSYRRMVDIFNMNEREFHAFLRQFANKSSGLSESKDKKPARSVFYTQSSDLSEDTFAYIVEADGYLKGTVLAKIHLSENNILNFNETESEVANADSNREMLDSWDESLWTGYEGYIRSFVISGNGRTKGKDVGTDESFGYEGSQESAEQGGSYFDDGGYSQRQEEQDGLTYDPNVLFLPNLDEDYTTMAEEPEKNAAELERMTDIWAKAHGICGGREKAGHHSPVIERA